MAVDTTDPSYWLNWRFLLCALGIVVAVLYPSYLIWKHEGYRRQRRERRVNQQNIAGSLYEDEAWRTCLTTIHPAWLLAFRSCAFSVLLGLLVTNIATDSFGVMYFYTQWTFTLVTIYFGVGCVFSAYGWRKHSTERNNNRTNLVSSDVERGTFVAPSLDGNANISSTEKDVDDHKTTSERPIAGFWGFAFQWIFQVAAGAVLLTDSVFWFLIYPFLTSASYRLRYMDICLHSLNAVFLLGDTFLNGMRFPFFRISYFVLWTAVFVIVQWIIHTCISIDWPYPFMDLSSPYAPAWYLAVGVMHLPCYGLFALIVRLKNYFLSRRFPDYIQSTQ